MNYVFLEANQKPAPKQYFEEEICVAYPQEDFLFKTFHTASLTKKYLKYLPQKGLPNGIYRLDPASS
jgi:hypothetical protein